MTFDTVYYDDTMYELRASPLNLFIANNANMVGVRTYFGTTLSSLLAYDSKTVF
jgi:hypothetical protein